MRQVLLGDILAAARALALIDPPARQPHLNLWLDQAHAAHKYMKRYARPHPTWGLGSIEGRVGAYARAPLNLADPTLLTALAFVAQTLTARRKSLALPPKRSM